MYTHTHAQSLPNIILQGSNTKPPSNGIVSPGSPVTFITATPPLQPKLSSGPPPGSPNYNPVHSSPSLSLDSPSEPHRERKKPSKGSPKIKVKKVHSVETTTDKQSFAQIVLYLGSTNKRSPSFKEKDKITHVTSISLQHPPVADHHKETSISAEEAPSIDQQAKSDKRLSQLVELADQLEQIERESKGQGSDCCPGNGEKGRTSEGDTDPVEEDQHPASESLGSHIQAELETRACPDLRTDLVNGLDCSELPQSRETLRSPTDSTATASDTSTVVARELASSRCSESFLDSEGEEDFGTSSTRAEYREDSPTFEISTKKLVFTDNPLTPTTALLSDGQEELQNLHCSPAQLSNPTGVSVLDNTGFFPLEFRGSSSQGTASVSYFSPRFSDATTFHFDLSQSQASQTEESGGELGIESKRNSFTKNTSVSPVAELTSSPPQVPLLPPVGFGGSHLGLIDEEPDTKYSHLSSDSHFPYGYRSGTSQGQLNSNRSSTCSIDSTANSIIVVSYNTGEKVSDVHEPALPSDPTYLGGDSLLAERRGVAKLPQLPNTTDSEEGRNLPMAGRSEVLMIVPPVPHHSLNVSTSGNSPPDSSSPPHLAHGFPSQSRSSPPRVVRTLYVVPSGSDQKIKATDVFGETPHKEEGFKDVKVSVVMLPGDKRLGFNVVGGRDQGAHLRVEAIAGCK